MRGKAPEGVSGRRKAEAPPPPPPPGCWQDLLWQWRQQDVAAAQGRGNGACKGVQAGGRQARTLPDGHCVAHGDGDAVAVAEFNLSS